MEFIDVINENDEVIGKTSKEEIYDKRLLHRIVHIFVFNDRGEMALQLQSKNKKFCPQHWCTAAAGHVKSGETPEEAALRELEEEIGIRTKVELLSKDLFNVYDDFNKLLISFKASFNGPFKINPWEVEKVNFFSLDEIKEMINKGKKFHPELIFLLKKHFDINGPGEI